MNSLLGSLLGAALASGLGLLGVLSACSSDAGIVPDGGFDLTTIYPVDLALPSCTNPTSFATIRSSILPSCAGYGCHYDAPFAGGLDLTDVAAYSNLFGVPATKAPSLLRVKPGVPLASFLWHKLDNQLAMNGTQGAPMPLGAENLWFALPAEKRAQIYCWIQAGAPNN